MQVSETDVSVILSRANAGTPLKIVEIYRLAVASGTPMPKPRRFQQIVDQAETKLMAGLRDVLAEMQQEPERMPVPRKRLRKART